MKTWNFQGDEWTSMSQDYPDKRDVIGFLSFSLVHVFNNESDPEAPPSNSLGLNTNRNISPLREEEKEEKISPFP